MTSTPPDVPRFLTLAIAIMSAGLASLITTIISLWINGRREHKRWVLDNKKMEWRELLDVVNACAHLLGINEDDLKEVPPAQQLEINLTLLRATYILQDRIFIRDSIEREGLIRDWLALSELKETND